MNKKSKPKHRKLTAQQVANARIAEWKQLPAQRLEWSLNETSKFTHEVRVLFLSNCGLKGFPQALREVKGVEFLDLNNNKIREIPNWIGSLSLLEGINLRGNQLRTLPPQIGSLKRLVGLYLSNNKLEALPESLRSLKLEALDLQDNPRLGLPESILKRPPEEILRYYFESRAEKGQPLLELKLLLVGRGGAGKTTLAKRLAGEAPDARGLETHSIAIRELMLNCPSGLVRTRAWDFGGQEILHATHQFFLTERSLYILVLEPRSGLAQRDAEYWLKLIETQGESSPVVIAMNWCNGRRWQIDEVKLRRKFPFIVDFILTDALYGDGIDSLRETVIRTVQERMSDVWIPFPSRWRLIKDTVAGMRDNFLTYKQYAALCAKLGEDDSAAQADLAGILHALGLVLYFGKGGGRLHDTRVLNPGWVTGGVYAVIRAPSIAENYGQLSVGDMPRVLREAEEQKVIKASDYPPETHGFILDLMSACQLFSTWTLA